MRRNNIIAYWLVPEKDEGELFRELIRILARQFDAPRFEPHITLFTTAPDAALTREVIRQSKAKPVRLRIRGIGFSSAFTKTLFVRFASNQSLEKLVGGLAPAAKRHVQGPRDPHISLLYRNIAIGAKRELASTIRLPFPSVLFDTIKAVRCSSPMRNRAHVKAWRVIATKSLR